MRSDIHLGIDPRCSGSSRVLSTLSRFRSSLSRVCLFFFPVILPYLCLTEGLRQRRLRAVAKTQPCPSCGRCLGVAAVEAAEAYRERRVRRHEAQPTTKTLPVAIQVDAICTACGAHLRFDDGLRAFAGKFWFDRSSGDTSNENSTGFPFSPSGDFDK